MSTSHETDIGSICGYLSIPLICLAGIGFFFGFCASFDSGPASTYLLKYVALPAFIISYLLSGIGLFFGKSRAAGTLSGVIFIPASLCLLLLAGDKLGLI